MITKQCDRCGRFYFIYNTANDENHINGFCTVNIQNPTYYIHGPYDLCNVCSKELFKWFKDKKEDIDA